MNITDLTNIIISISNIGIVYLTYTIKKATQYKRNDDLFSIRYKFFKKLEKTLIDFAYDDIFPNSKENPEFIKLRKDNALATLSQEANLLFNEQISEYIKNALENPSYYLKVIGNLDKFVANDHLFQIFKKYLKLK
jgi:hypothetical protein